MSDSVSVPTLIFTPISQTITYAFFGLTESQVKSGKAIFFREDDQWSKCCLHRVALSLIMSAAVDSLLAEFGSGLDKVFLDSGYGKYAARLGLSFSSTVEACHVRLYLP